MAKKISAKTLKKSFRTWFFWNGCSQQAESMLGMAFGQAMAPVIEELYDTKEERAAALQRHITLFNTEARWRSRLSRSSPRFSTMSQPPRWLIGKELNHG